MVANEPAYVQYMSSVCIFSRCKTDAKTNICDSNEQDNWNKNMILAVFILLPRISLINVMKD